MTEAEPKSRVADNRTYWTHEVESYPHPVAQFRMAQLIDYDPRLTEPARIVYRFLVGWYMHSHGDALASVRQIVAAMRGRAPNGARELSRSAVQRAIILLVDNSWLTRKELGKGRRGSRYVPVANVLELAAMGKLPGSDPVEWDATDELSVPEKRDTCVPVERDATDDSVPPVGTKTRIPDPRTDAGTGIVNSVSAALGGGAEGATPADGFEEVWKAYKKHGAKKASRVAWEVIDWSQYDYGPEHVIERAMSWADSAKPGQRRMPLEKWLDAEKFDEADRAVEPKKAKTPSVNNTQITTPAAANDNHQPRREVVAIDGGMISDGRGAKYVRLKIVDCANVGQVDPEYDWLTINFESPERAEQEHGNKEIAALVTALGLDDVEDIDELCHIPFAYEQKQNGHYQFYPAPERAKEAQHA